MDEKRDEKKVEEENQQNYIDSLRKELIYLIERELTPLALKYRYSEVPLESNIKWKPMVLILGNYSSGKSTLVNEFLGHDIQHTGQAPTDDCFTVITGTDEDEEAGFVDDRDGKVLLYGEEYPFEVLKKYGEKFAAHFRLKKIAGVPRLKNLAIIDTPGMLDSVAEKDRGYNYQEVIGDLAQLSDLILVLFDPHKAGTIRESYASLRETLPKKTFEDRIIFVLNRIDECGNLEDLLRVYGTLCWNLSQMIGRKDIPRVLLTYSSSAVRTLEEKSFLHHLDNQREELQTAILKTPRHRLDHLATFVEHHSSRISHMLEALLQFGKAKKMFYLKFSLLGFLITLFLSGLIGLYFDMVEPFGEISEFAAAAWSMGIGIIFYSTWTFFQYKYMASWHHRRQLKSLHLLTNLNSQQAKDSWNSIENCVRTYIKEEQKKSSMSVLKKELEAVKKIHAKGAQEIRSAINNLGSVRTMLDNKDVKTRTQEQKMPEKSQQEARETQEAQLEDQGPQGAQEVQKAQKVHEIEDMQPEQESLETRPMQESHATQEDHQPKQETQDQQNLAESKTLEKAEISAQVQGQEDIQEEIIQPQNIKEEFEKVAEPTVSLGEEKHS